jgi:hypothetical protein
MSKRLQVVVEDAELRGFRRAAKRAGMTLSEWVRQTLRTAERATDVGDAARKREALRAAARYSFPAPDIEQMLEETERGYLDDGS